MTDRRVTRRRVLLGTGALVGLAGCSGLTERGTESTRSSPTGSDSTATDTEGAVAPPETESMTRTATETRTATATETETPAPTATDAGPGYKQDHWHGRLFFEIDGELVDFDQPNYYLDTIEDERPETVYFHFHDGAHGPNEWSNEKRIVTFQRALNLLPGIGYERRDGAHRVTYEGTAYDASRTGTDVTIHRGTERIDPTTYEVRHDDNFWVTVQTEEGTGSATDERSGKLVVDVNNRRLEFGSAARQAGSDRFEFRDDGEPYTWYSAGDPVTLERALATVPYLSYDRSGGGHVVRYESGDALAGTYRETADATQIIARQRTTPVDPTSYTLQDGDIVWVYVHTANAPDNEH
ncbi:hypothetical protein [Halosimplex salinum]|uniref:hypothetical protein n=1 Tax=Halosimplex salinum TaxID=1710538 RepID=UPI0013DDE0CC|nr:hypothetical protein [Halosimplex salinum]